MLHGRRRSAGPEQGSPQDACTPPPHCSYCSFILLCFCLQTTFFLSLGCWLQAALLGFAPGLAGRETWAGPGAGVQGVLLGLSRASPIRRPRRPLGSWGDVCGGRGCAAGQGVPLPPGFPLHPGPAAPQGDLGPSEQGLGISGNFGKPHGWRWDWGSCQRCVGGRNVPILHCLGRPALEWKGSHLFVPSPWMFLLPSSREELRAWEGWRGARAWDSTPTPEPHLSLWPGVRGARGATASPLMPCAPEFSVKADSPHRELRFSLSCGSESQSGSHEPRGAEGGVLTGEAELGPLGLCS